MSVQAVPVSPTESQLALGRRVAEQRRRHGWSQPELAQRLGKPVSWVSQLERGLVPAEPMEVLRTAAGGRLDWGTADAAPGSTGTDQVNALRRVLDHDHQYQPRQTVLAIQTAASRQSLTDQVWDLTIAGRYGDLADLVRALLPVVHATLRACTERRRAGLYQLLAASYQACSAALAKLGDPDAAAAAADRALAAAEHADDPLAVAGSAYLLVCVLMDAERHEAALAIASAAAAALIPASAEGSLAAISFRGALTLLCALCAARDGDSATAEEYVSMARVMAGRLSHFQGESASGFSADHVALYEIAVSIESAAAAHSALGLGTEG